MSSGPPSALHLLPARRQWLRRAALAGMAGLAGAGCSTPPPLRIGAHPWPGYELMHLAHQRGFLHPGQLRLLEVPTATASLRALAAGTLDGAGLTLDEVLSARARGLMLRVVAVIDVSDGADVLLAAPDIPDLAALRGRRVGVEANATGALMLDAALGRAGLTTADIRLVPLEFTAHAEALRQSRVDAVVTFEPVRTQMLAAGAKALFSSAQVPGLIVDVLAVRPEALQHQGDGLRVLVAGLLQARQAWQRDPDASAASMAPRLRLSPAQVRQTFGLLQLPDLAGNRQWLAGDAPRLTAAARHLVTVMQRAALLPPGARTLDGALHAGLADPAFLPQA